MRNGQTFLDEMTRRRAGDMGDLGDSSHQKRESAGRPSGDPGRFPGAPDPVMILNRARKLLSPQSVTGLEYPIDALGPLAPACEAIAERGQMAEAMAGQCLLSTASLLAQSIANVRTLAGVKPLSTYCFTIADSGDGKSTAEKVAQHPVHQRQKRDAAAHRQQVEEYQRQKRDTKEPDVEVGRPPYRIMRDGTVEGLRAGFQHGLPSQGIFTAEAAIMLSGYGMTPDNRAKTCGTLNALWDDGEISVSRSVTGRVQLYGRRLALHWLIQPDAARSALYDPLMSGIGFWPRFLVAWPQPAAPRRAIPFNAEDDPAIRAYWHLCDYLLDHPLGDDCDDLPVILPDADAMEMAGQFFERMEVAAKTRDGYLTNIRPFAARATEQAFRVAGVLAVFADRSQIDRNAMRDAIALVSYSLDTWRTIFGDREQAEAESQALLLLDWMTKQPGMLAAETAILHIGPKAIRSKARRDAALAVLKHAGFIERNGSDWRIVECGE